MRRFLSLGLLLLIGVMSQGCVKKALYEAALSDIAGRDAELASLAADPEGCRDSLATTQGDLARRTGELNNCDAKALQLASERDELITDMSAKSKEARLLAQSLDETRQAMEAMRARQSAAEERNRIYRQLLDRFRSMIDAGTLDVSIERGRLVINLKQDILFGSGSSQVETVGEETLLEVASALSEFPNRMFQVEGHTDNVPIATARFPSNWELSTARAISVVADPTENWVPAQRLAATGFAEFQPLDPRQDESAFRRNRRIELKLTQR
jgi:chemotaxis protein MotB